LPDVKKMGGELSWCFMCRAMYRDLYLGGLGSTRSMNDTSLAIAF